MELINQHTKQVMEGCKQRARDAGLRFQDESLEYIVTNKDLLELSPKNMIPTLYDYWVHDLEVLKEKGRYELYPNNPYETVINTRPAISFYNDNNPDWLNVMIFYHVLAHIDFFQNNMLFKPTWSEDFTGKALSDKRLLAMLRSEKGRWVDYVIEFARGIDNLVGFYRELTELNLPPEIRISDKIDFYFDVFLQKVKKVRPNQYLKEIDRYNNALKQSGEMAETVFFSKIIKIYPEFDALFKKYTQKEKTDPKDLLQYLEAHSPFLRKEENSWMKQVLQIVRGTSLFFQPQIRTKIMNEGWASYWHDKLFLEDDRICGNEVGFARVNAKVTALPRVGMNPYALGMRLFANIEDLAEKGKLSYDFQKMKDALKRRKYDRKTGTGQKVVFDVRENFADFTFINTFIDQDFVDQHKLFVAGKRLHAQKGVWEYFVKSRNATDYKQMLLDSLYHPPYIEIDAEQTKDGVLYLNHRFEGKPLVNEFIANTMMGIEFLWGAPVKLETSGISEADAAQTTMGGHPGLFGGVGQKPKSDQPPEFKRIVYHMENKKLSHTFI